MGVCRCERWKGGGQCRDTGGLRNVWSTNHFLPPSLLCSHLSWSWESAQVWKSTRLSPLHTEFSSVSYQPVKNFSFCLMSEANILVQCRSRFRLEIKRTKNTIFKKNRYLIKVHQKWQLFHTLTYYPIKNKLCHQFSNLFYQQRGDTRLILILDLCCASAVTDDFSPMRTKKASRSCWYGSRLCSWDDDYTGIRVIMPQERWRRTLYIRRAEQSRTMRRGEVRNNAETGKSISTSLAPHINLSVLTCDGRSQCRNAPSYPAYQE